MSNDFNTLVAMLGHVEKLATNRNIKFGDLLCALHEGRTQELIAYHEDEDEATIRADDEFVAVVVGQERDFGVIVQRNGTPTNRFSDGTKGVPLDIQQAASEEETLFRLNHRLVFDGKEYNWRLAWFNTDGSFHAWTK